MGFGFLFLLLLLVCFDFFSLGFNFNLDKRTFSLIHGVSYNLLVTNATKFSRLTIFLGLSDDSYSILCQNMLLSSVVMISDIAVFLHEQQMVCVCI